MLFNKHSILIKSEATPQIKIVTLPIEVLCRGIDVGKLIAVFVNMVACWLLLAVYVSIINCQDRSSTSEDDILTVRIPHGRIKGRLLKARSGRDYLLFQRVPFAQPPRKFEPPVPLPLAPSGDINIDATQPSPLCPQLVGTTYVGQEDCLYLTVNVPKVILQNRQRHNLGPLYPVIVFVYGGAFAFGWNDEYGGKYFMDEDVVLVAINYRVGALGFLSTGDGEILGNMGLKDQVLALRWIQSNIGYFGGDPARVTLYGESAGAVCAQLHIFSSMSAGLFSQVIAHSGSALAPWAISKNPVGIARKFGSKLDCNSTSSEHLALCLKSKDVKDIVMAQLQLIEWHFDPLVPFSPTVEVPITALGFIHPSTQLFLAADPYQLLLARHFHKVPLLTGVNKDEGLLYHSETILANEQVLASANKEWHRIAPITLQYSDTVKNPSKRDHISDKIRSFYFGNKEIGTDTRNNLTNLYTDRYFVHGVQSAAYGFALFMPVYLFLFSYLGVQSNLRVFGINDVRGVAHSDDLQYFFECTTLGNIAPGSPDEEYSKKIIKTWVSFAYNGRPIGPAGDQDWLPVTPHESLGQVPPRYYDLTESRYIESPFTIRVRFWNHLVNSELREELFFVADRGPK